MTPVPRPALSPCAAPEPHGPAAPAAGTASGTGRPSIARPVPEAASVDPASGELPAVEPASGELPAVEPAAVEPAAVGPPAVDPPVSGPPVSGRRGLGSRALGPVTAGLLVAALSGPGLMVAAQGMANDYPTAARADYVFACMAANGQTQDALNRCSCSIDAIAEVLPYDRYVEAETVLRMRLVPGERAVAFRGTAMTTGLVADLRRAQAEAEILCF